MKIVSGALAGLMLAGTAWSAPAQAQGVPQGTYMRSCGNIGMQGDTLVAICRTADGRERRTSLPAVYGCVGDIDNVDPELLRHLIAGGYTPVIAPFTVDATHQILNTNADTVAAAIAVCTSTAAPSMSRSRLNWSVI